MRRPLLLAAFVTAFALPGAAEAAGGSYVFDGGTPRQQLEVRSALEASAFPWDVVPGTVTVHIAPGQPSRARPGHVWLDADLLDGWRWPEARGLAWAVVQDEFAHQVDFLLLDADARVRLAAELDADDWCYGVRGLEHAAYGCERFASTLVWAYWPSPRNAYRPRSPRDESAAMAPPAFRALLGEILGISI